MFSGKWSMKHGNIVDGKPLPEDFEYLSGIFARERICANKTAVAIRSFEVEDREWPPTVPKIIARCKQAGEISPQHREYGVDFTVVPQVKRANISKVQADIQKLKSRMRAA
jgi:hypothetical protein